MSNIFSANADYRKNAYMNWKMSEESETENLIAVATGFELAAQRLMDFVLADNSSHDADALIFPIMYSIDQSIEVYLKAILCRLEVLLGIPVKICVKHDIKELLTDIEKKIATKEGKTDGLEEHLKPLTEYIDELYQYIQPNGGKPQMDFARYPFDTKGNPFFYASTKSNVEVDIENLKKVYTDIMDSIGSLYEMYSQDE